MFVMVVMSLQQNLYSIQGCSSCFGATPCNTFPRGETEKSKSSLCQQINRECFQWFFKRNRGGETQELEKAPTMSKQPLSEVRYKPLRSLNEKHKLLFPITKAQGTISQP